MSLWRLAGDRELRGICRSQAGDLRGDLADLQHAAEINLYVLGIRLDVAAVYKRLDDASAVDRERSFAASLLRLQQGR